MNLTHRGKVYALIAVLAASFSFLITPFNFPHLGLSLSLIIFAVFSYSLKKEKTADTNKFLLLSLLFSLFNFVRSEEFITFVNIVGAIFFGGLMLTSNPKNKFGFLEVVSAPFHLVLKSIFEKSDYYLEYKEGSSSSKSKKSMEAVFGILITVLVLAIVLPLLAFSNPIFEKTVLNVWNFLNFSELFQNFKFEDQFVWLIRFIFFMGFLFILPKLLTQINKKLPEIKLIDFSELSLPLMIPKLAVAVVLVIFFVTQIQFYFASPEMLTNIGITLSERSREVFAHLSVVAVIIFALIYNDKKSSVISKNITLTLAIEGIFLIFTAYKSVFDYIFTWGLTYKRLYGVTVATFILAVFVFFLVYYLNKKSVEWFVKKVIFSIGLFLIVINLLNFDYLIYNSKKSTTERGIDYNYLSTLSPDSRSYGDQIKTLEGVHQETEGKSELFLTYDPWRLVNKIERLQNKYTDFDVRSFSLLEYLQYLEVKEVDVQKYFKLFEPRLDIR